MSVTKFENGQTVFVYIFFVLQILLLENINKFYRQYILRITTEERHVMIPELNWSKTGSHPKQEIIVSVDVFAHWWRKRQLWNFAGHCHKRNESESSRIWIRYDDTTYWNATNKSSEQSIDMPITYMYISADRNLS